jgi:hypothetical protein
MLQAKLTVGRSRDPFEREADRVAEQVVNTTDSVQSPATPLAAGRHAPTVQRMPETEDNLRVLQGPHEAFEGPLEEDEPVIRRMPQLEGDEEPALQMTPMAEEEDETLRMMPVEGEAEDEAVPSPLPITPAATRLRLKARQRTRRSPVYKPSRMLM